MSDLATATHALVAYHLDYYNALYLEAAFDNSLEILATARLTSAALQGLYNSPVTIISLAPHLFPGPIQTAGYDL